MTRTRFAIEPTPVGDVLLLHSDAGLLALDVLHDPLGAVLEGWSRRLGAMPEPDERASAAAGQLSEYFEGLRRTFEVTLDWALVHGFTRAALEAVCTIPYGQTASYGEVAALAGSPRAHRAVGSACAQTPFSIIVPAHRVVRADGAIGEYGGHPEVKRFLLDLEAGARAGV